jgi:hypothetical protein
MSLDKIKEKCAKYSTPDYVFKYCKETYKNIFRKREKNIIIVLQKLEGENPTITNESRNGIIDPNYAKFRASHLKVILIFDMDHPEIEYESIINKLFDYTLLTYRRDCIVYADKFDKNLDNICSNGIHYFKTVDGAFYYQSYWVNKTGKYIYYNDDGSKYKEGDFSKKMFKYCNYDSNGNLIREDIYFDSVIAHIIQYNSDGEIINEWKSGSMYLCIKIWYKNLKT